MKKLLSIVFTLALIFCLSATVFAAPSTEETVTVNGATDGNGASLTVTLADTSTTITSEEAADEVGATAATVLGIRDVTVPDGTTFPVTITFNVEGVATGDTVYCLHWNGSSWDKLDATAGDGTITCTFSSLSPVAFVAEASSTSPQTNEGMYIVIVGIIAIAALATAYGVSRRARA